MKSTHTFSLNFYLRADREASGHAPMYVRITVDGKVAHLTTKTTVLVSNWNQKLQRLNGKSPENDMIRDRMRLIAADLNKAYDELRFQKEIVTAEKVKAKLESGEVGKLLTELIKYHYDEPGTLLSPGTIKNYYSTERFLLEFLKKKKLKDIELSKIDFKFVSDFAIYLRKKPTDKLQRPCTNNTVMKHMERFRKLMGLALQFNWVVRDPFLHFKRQTVLKDREVLTDDEIKSLVDVNLGNTLSVVRDMFIFSCYTGLAFAEINSLSERHISVDSDGVRWLAMQRKKTFNTTQKHFHVVLLPEALEVIERYKNAIDSAYRQTIFPCPCNQYTNRCLKVIAEKARIAKKLSFHTARHTFATTITLQNGVSIESVSHMLGHSRQTPLQH